MKQLTTWLFLLCTVFLSLVAGCAESNSTNPTGVAESSTSTSPQYTERQRPIVSGSNLGEAQPSVASKPKKQLIECSKFAFAESVEVSIPVGDDKWVSVNLPAEGFTNSYRESGGGDTDIWHWGNWEKFVTLANAQKVKLPRLQQAPAQVINGVRWEPWARVPNGVVKIAVELQPTADATSARKFPAKLWCSR